MTDSGDAAGWIRAAKLQRQRWLVQMLLLARRDGGEDLPETGRGWPALVRLACQYGARGPTEPGPGGARGGPATPAEFERLSQVTVAELFGKQERVDVAGGLL